LRKIASAASNTEIIKKEATAYKGLKEGMALTSQQLLDFIETQVIASYDDRKLILGAPGIADL